MKDDLVEKVARAMCMVHGGDPDSPIRECYKSFAEPAVRVVLEEVEKTVKQWGKEQIEKADKFDSPEASDHGRARAWDATQIAHLIRALGEKT